MEMENYARHRDRVESRNADSDDEKIEDGTGQAEPGGWKLEWNEEIWEIIETAKDSQLRST